MSGSLHLSDLSFELSATVSGLSERENSFNSIVGSYGPQIKQIADRSNRLKEYAEHLCKAKSKLDQAQIAFDSDLRRSKARLDDDEEQIKNQIESIREQRNQLKARKDDNDRSVVREKRSMLDLESEALRIAKTSEWSESILETTDEFEARSRTRDEIVRMGGEINNLNSQIREMRREVFVHQAKLAEISDSIGPLRVRMYTLQTRIDDEQDDDELDESCSSLQQTRGETRTVAVSQQKLIIEKMRIMKRMDQLRADIEVARSEKIELLKRLAPLRVQDESGLEKITMQTEQYVEAMQRHRELSSRAAATKEECVIREIDIKMERETIAAELESVRKGSEVAKGVLVGQRGKMQEIEKWLNSNRPIDDVTMSPDDITYESILSDTISMIRRQREDEVTLSNTSMLSDEITVDETELDEVRERTESRLQRIRQSIEAVKNDGNALEQTIRQTESSIMETKQEMKNVEAEATSPAKIVVEVSSPKISRESKRIQQLEASLAKARAKCEKKRSKIRDFQASLADLRQQINTPENFAFLSSDISDRVERSMKWLLPNIRKQKALWADAGTLTYKTQLVNDWDSKIIGAAVNEADDMSMRASALHQ